MHQFIDSIHQTLEQEKAGPETAPPPEEGPAANPPTASPAGDAPVDNPDGQPEGTALDNGKSDLQEKAEGTDTQQAAKS